MVYLAAVLVALVYLANFPVRVYAAVNINQEPNAFVRVYLFNAYVEWRGRVKRREDESLALLLMRMRGNRAENPSEREVSFGKIARRFTGRAPAFDGKTVSDLWAALRRFLKTVTVQRLRLHVRVGTGDAAGTALAYGAIAALVSALQSACPNAPVEARLYPDFERAQLLLGFSGMVRWKLGHSMLAAWRCFAAIAIGRGRVWKNNRIKATATRLRAS